MKVVLELDELELRAIMFEIWNATQKRGWYCISSPRMNDAECPNSFEDKIDDVQLAFKKRTIDKVRRQLKKQGINIDYRYALIYDEEIPEVKNFLITNNIIPTCPEHREWVK